MPSIINSDDGVVSGTSGLKTTGGNDGITTFQQNGTERMRIDSSGNVGIGTTSPNLGGVNKAITLNSAAGTNASYELSINGTFIGSMYTNTADSSLRFGGWQNAPMVFLTNSTERMRINAGAPILCLSGGNTSATGTGIAFPATQSASSDANTLDDYEEGTFTPTVTGGSSAGTTVYGTQDGRYVKIGKQVTVAVVVGVTSATGTGNIFIGGFPFTSASDFGGCGPLMVEQMDWSASTGYVQLYMGQSRTYAMPYLCQDNVNWGSQGLSNESQNYIFTLTYFV